MFTWALRSFDALFPPPLPPPFLSTMMVVHPREGGEDVAQCALRWGALRNSEFDELDVTPSATEQTF